jgi:lysophospholipase L1-like esterase
MKRTTRIFEFMFFMLGALSTTKDRPTKRNLFWSVFAFVFIIISPAAYGQIRFSETVSFGDSLTSNDRLWIYFDNPEDLYGADPMEAVFKKARGPNAELTNYALEGTVSDQLHFQVDAYEANLDWGDQNSATFISIETGGNDVLDEVALLGKYAPGTNAVADEVGRNIYRNMRSALGALRGWHPRANFVVWTIPDITLTPGLWHKLSKRQIQNIRAHLKRVNKAITKLGGSKHVVVLDLYALLQDFVANPPVIYGQALLRPPVTGKYNSIFADKIHPTAVSNALIANAMIEAINKKWGLSIPLYTKRELAWLAHIKR